MQSEPVRTVCIKTGATFWGADGAVEEVTITRKDDGRIRISGISAKTIPYQFVEMEYNNIQLRFELKDSKGKLVGVYIIFDNPPPGQWNGSLHNPPVPIEQMYKLLKDGHL